MPSSNAKESQWEIKPCPIVGGYGLQRFPQWSPEDCANWYVVSDANTKNGKAMYPCMGRAHINYLSTNQLVFGSEPRGLFKTITYAYIVVGNTIYRVDNQYNLANISGSQVQTTGGAVYVTFLVVNKIVFACFVDSQKIYIYREDTGTFYTVTDTNAPGNNGEKPGFIATFGNRIVVSESDSTQFFLSQINLGGSAFDPATCFTIAGSAVFAQASNIIRQMGVLNNILYIFTYYTTEPWFNSSSLFSGTGTTFPWTQNSSYNWNFGIANPASLDIDFGMITFLAQNSDGLLQFMASNGGQPEKFSNFAIDTLVQKSIDAYGSSSSFLAINSNGFLYQYENRVFYRFSGGDYTGTGILDSVQNAVSIECILSEKSWHRCIELNGERNRIQNYVFFNYIHLVTVVGDSTVYQMSGKFYTNEITNPAQSDSQASDAYIVYPFRYERVTPIIYEEDYSEFETEFVQIDMVWGDSNINFSIYAPNPPNLNDDVYDTFIKPSVELFYSDDGGISFQSADIRQFSQEGVYIWRMRWYQLGPSRDRSYNLVCVSPVPVVPLGATMLARRMSGGAL